MCSIQFSDLDTTEDELQAPQAQRDGEEDQVPQGRIGRDHTQVPQRVVKQVTAVPTIEEGERGMGGGRKKGVKKDRDG